jgi:hypothetical protein
MPELGPGSKTTEQMIRGLASASSQYASHVVDDRAILEALAAAGARALQGQERPPVVTGEAAEQIDRQEKEAGSDPEDVLRIPDDASLRLAALGAWFRADAHGFFLQCG